VGLEFTPSRCDSVRDDAVAADTGRVGDLDDHRVPTVARDDVIVLI
jgi:hypothetical protein